ncbi:fasciclin-1 isoform X3 [Daphnia magna]|uniref:fasciclin-1 isoform X3 n=1 Tax=Daphnia magna TaxID=35525 RepID=UPI001E1BB29E|nr:fasciclin-1 isoform X3 [Daphnia magna]
MFTHSSSLVTLSLLAMSSWLAFASAVGPVMNQQPTIFDLIQNDPDLSEFFNLISRNELVPTLLKFRQATVFAPNNEAMRAFTGQKDQDLLLYHLANVALTTDKLDQSVSSELPGNPPLWIARRDASSYQYDFYINDARVIRGDIKAMSTRQDEQVLHVIDKVLEPIMTSARDPQLSNPDAARLLERAGSFNLGPYQISDFVQQVTSHKKLSVFATPGRHTFLIPINRGFEAVSRDKIDPKVIDGHIVPNVALFSRPAIRGRPVQTLAFSDNLKVTISFSNESLPSQEIGSRIYVQSNTLVGDFHHPRGVVVAQVVKANIPVRNGVVHLIDKPLIVIDIDIVNFLKEQRNGILYEFYRIMKDFATNFMEGITGAGELTLLAPSNEAFRKLGEKNLNALLANQQKLTEILQLHVIRRRLSSDEIIQNPLLSHVESADRHRRLYFSAFGPDDNITVSVEGGGVNATIIQPDIGALNGIVHIIDRVLGVPTMTVIEKLQSDPIMSKTHALAIQDDFLGRMQAYRDPYNPRIQQKFTMLVPSDDAWEVIHRTMGSAFKKLFMGEYSYNVRQILERHLVVGQELSINNLTSQGRDNYLQTIRGKVKIVFVENGGENGGEPTREYFAEWENIRARVVRPDVQCIDGVIHVIDHVLVQRREISVSGSERFTVNALLLLAITLTAIFWNARALQH